MSQLYLQADIHVPIRESLDEFADRLTKLMPGFIFEETDRYDEVPAFEAKHQAMKFVLFGVPLGEVDNSYVLEFVCSTDLSIKEFFTQRARHCRLHTHPARDVTATRLQFNWRSVAASAVSAGAAQGLNAAMDYDPRLTGNLELGKSLASGVGGSIVGQAVRGGRVSATTMATDAFGNVLGDSIAAANGQKAIPAPVSTDERARIMGMFADGPGSNSTALRPDMAPTTANNLLSDLGLGRPTNGGRTLYADASSAIQTQTGIVTDAGSNGTLPSTSASDSDIPGPASAQERQRIIDIFKSDRHEDTNENEMDKQSGVFGENLNSAKNSLRNTSTKLTEFQNSYLINNLQTLTQNRISLSNDDITRIVERVKILPPLGSLSSHFETGGRGPGVVSTGAGGDRGGVSYGSYQMASNFGIPQDFLANEGAQWSAQFVGMNPQISGGDFAATWKSVAAINTEEFQNAQHNYIGRTHYDAVLNLATKFGFTVADIGVQNALWSQSVQSSFKPGNVTILTIATANFDPNISTPAQQINALYDARSSYTTSINIRPPSAGAPRYAQERPGALQLSNNFPLDKK